MNFLMSIIFVIFISFFLFYYIFYKLSYKINFLDHPNQRKLHSGSIPMSGGLTIFFSLLPMFLFIEFTFWQKLFFFSSTIILLLGLIDDFWDIGVSIRLVAQLAASLLIIGGGLSIVDVGDYAYISNIELGVTAILLTIIAVMGLTNAINFMDGIDGLCSSQVIISFITICVYSFFSNNFENLLFLYPIIFSLILFLFVNFGNKKIGKIFLGDSGSTFLGFILAWTLIYYSHPSIRNFHPVLCVWCVSIPCFDLLCVIIRRLLRKINPLRPDRRHLHHLLIKKYKNQTKVLILINSYSIFSSILGGFCFYFFGPGPALMVFFFWFVIYLLLSILISRSLSYE